MSYDPAVGKWLQQDPDEFDAGDPDLYRYVDNDPVNATDPSGLADDHPAGKGPYSAKSMLDSFLQPVGPGNLKIPIASPPVLKKGGETNFSDPFWAIPWQGWESIGITSPNEQNLAMATGVAITAFKAPDAAHRLLPELKNMNPNYYKNLSEKDLANSIQHVLWLSLLSLRMGEKKAKDIAWIHEQYGSDGWADTLKDFHNNNVGLAVAEEISKEIGPDGMLIFTSGGTQDNLKWKPKVDDPQLSRYQQVQLEIYTKMREKNEQNLFNRNTAVYDHEVNITKYPDILNDARRFWDADVSYSRPSKDPAHDRKPAIRP